MFFTANITQIFWSVRGESNRGEYKNHQNGKNIQGFFFQFYSNSSEKEKYVGYFCHSVLSLEIF